MNLAAVMDALAVELDKIDGLRVYGWPPDQVQPPAAVVGFPDSYTFDETYGRAADRMEVPVWIVVARVSDRTARGALAAYCDGSGAKSVKATLEAGTYTAMHTIRVTTVEFVPFTAAQVDYLAAMFTCDVLGQGA